ncbi:hypothetical protein SLA2020_446590 [Shorea laevis]
MSSKTTSMSSTPKSSKTHTFSSLFLPTPIKLAVEISDNLNVDISFKGPPTTSTAAQSGPSMAGSQKLKLRVVSKCGTRKITVEMNASDNVEELRKELRKLQRTQLLPLPSEGFFFIHKQNVMDDNQSFQWHHVAQGDTIEIFNGTITGGS